MESSNVKNDTNIAWTIIFRSVRIGLSIQTILLISYGLFLLITVKGLPASTNNMVGYTNITLLIILSISGLSESLLYIIAQIGWFLKHDEVYRLSRLFEWVVGAVYFSTVYLITSNRLLSSVYPIWYRTSMTKTAFFVGVLALCVVLTGLSVTGAVMYFSDETNTSKMGAGILTSVYGSYIMFSICTYTTIFRTIRQSRRISRPNPTDETSSNSFGFIYKRIKEEGYVIPFVITFTYTLFVIVPGIITVVCKFTNNGTCVDVTHSVWSLTYVLNTISDSCIYIFSDKNIYRYLRDKFKRNRVNEDNLQMSDMRIKTKSATITSDNQ